MEPTEFPQANVRIAEGQEEYITIPAHVVHDVYGETTFCWKLTLRERVKLLFTGKLWHKVLTFGSSLQPQLLGVDDPFPDWQATEEAEH